MFNHLAAQSEMKQTEWRDGYEELDKWRLERCRVVRRLRLRKLCRDYLTTVSARYPSPLIVISFPRAKDLIASDRDFSFPPPSLEPAD